MTNATMIIRVNNLKLRAFIGVYEWEKKIRQNVTISLWLEIKSPTDRHDVDQTVDYKDLTDRVTELVENNRFGLLEQLSAELIEILKQNKKIIRGGVRIDKPGALPFADSASVEESF